MTFTQGHAVLIGVNSYQHAPHVNVPITATDVLSLADTLRNPNICGYPTTQVTVLTDADATRAGIEATLTNLAQRITTDDTVLLCYSGHGQYDTQNTYCLMTHDTQLITNTVVPGTALSHSELLTLVRALPARRVLLILNACHAGALSPTLTAEVAFTGTPIPDEMNAALLATGEGRVIITACRADQYSFIGTGPQTIFMQALIEGFHGAGATDQDDYINIFNLYTHLYRAVGESVQKLPDWQQSYYGSRQEPELTILKGVGPFAVALSRGRVPSKYTTMTTDLPRGGAVRTVDSNMSQYWFDHMQYTTGNHNMRVGEASPTTKSYTEAPTVPTSMTVRHVHTGGGDYAEHNIDKRQYGVSGTIDSSGVDLITQAHTHIKQEIQRAQQHSNWELVEDLNDVATKLEHARMAQQRGNTHRQQEKTQAVCQTLQTLVSRHPQLQSIIDMLIAS